MLTVRLPPLEHCADAAKADAHYEVTVGDDGLELSINGRRRSQPRDRLGTVNRIVGHLQLDLARHARGLTFVHAGVVRYRGVGIVVPGRSNSGKSTLVKAFCAAGAAYASDEFAVIDRRGRVFPFPRPIALRRQGGGVERVAPATLAGGVISRSCQVGLLLFPRFKQRAEWRPRQLSPALALLELLRHTVAARERPHQAMVALRAVVETAPALAGVRGDAGELVEGVMRELRQGRWARR